MQHHPMEHVHVIRDVIFYLVEGIDARTFVLVRYVLAERKK